MPDRPKHECKKCVAAPHRPHDGGRTDDVAQSRNGLNIWQVVNGRPICLEQAPCFSNCGLKYRLSFHRLKKRQLNKPNSSREASAASLARLSRRL
jgi:hypothetical protein